MDRYGAQSGSVDAQNHSKADGFEMLLMFLLPVLQSPCRSNDQYRAVECFLLSPILF